MLLFCVYVLFLLLANAFQIDLWFKPSLPTMILLMLTSIHNPTDGNLHVLHYCIRLPSVCLCFLPAQFHCPVTTGYISEYQGWPHTLSIAGGGKWWLLGQIWLTDKFCTTCKLRTVFAFLNDCMSTNMFDFWFLVYKAWSTW
jgi:hypothetical protein